VEEAGRPQRGRKTIKSVVDKDAGGPGGGSQMRGKSATKQPTQALASQLVGAGSSQEVHRGVKKGGDVNWVNGESANKVFCVVTGNGWGSCRPTRKGGREAKKRGVVQERGKWEVGTREPDNKG